MDAATSLVTAEQALRDLLSAVMYQAHGSNWMDAVVKPEQREKWRILGSKKQSSELVMFSVA